jgi:hypothetical protein
LINITERRQQQRGKGVIGNPVVATVGFDFFYREKVTKALRRSVRGHSAEEMFSHTYDVRARGMMTSFCPDRRRKAAMKTVYRQDFAYV